MILGSRGQSPFGLVRKQKSGQFIFNLNGHGLAHGKRLECAATYRRPGLAHQFPFASYNTQ